MQTISLSEGFNYTFLIPVNDYEQIVVMLRKAKFDCTYEDTELTGNEITTPKVRITVYCNDVCEAALVRTLIIR